MIYRLSFESLTWNREAYELIDYNSKNLFKDNYEIKKSGYIYRNDNDIIFSDEKDIEKKYEQLLKVIKNEDDYEITTNEIEKNKNGTISSLNTAWFLLKNSKVDDKFNKYKIHQGDIIKIGRIVSRIREIKFDKNKNNKNNYFEDLVNNSKYSNKFKLKDIDEDVLIQKKDTNINSKYHAKIIDMENQRNPTNPNFKESIQIIKIDNQENKLKENNLSRKKIQHIKIKKKDKVCRICYIEEEDEENPIVQPCHCSGSCKYIHIKCLKQWIMKKSCVKIDQNEECCVYLFSESECELCKMKLPDFFEHNGKLISLLDFSDDFKNYLILESLTLDRENNKFLYIVSINKDKEIRIGRGQQCSILLSDVSISRIHCFFIVRGKNVYLKDNDSKFGTLVLIQPKSIKMIEGLPLYIQVGRTFFNFLIKKEIKLFGCCGVSENSDIFHYYKQNEKQIETDRIFTVKTEVENSNVEDEMIDEEKKSNIKEDDKKTNDFIEA